LLPSCSSSFIIGPDGQPLTDEERAFLEENFGKLEANDATLDNDDLSDEYDEFLTTVDNEEAKKCVAEIEVAEIEQQLARSTLTGGLDRRENGPTENGTGRTTT
uniref:DUF2052 domain-containing protein n=1 Tax=Gongylonema pulchrum TaxID=637853 RepID=A0A183D2R1_9BILA